MAAGILTGPGGDELEQSEVDGEHDDDEKEAPSRQVAVEDEEEARNGEAEDA